MKHSVHGASESLRAVIVGALLLAVLCGCAHAQPDAEGIEPWYPATSKSGDPIFGVFEGRIPCVGRPGCEKIKVALVVYADSNSKTPMSYTLARVYVAANPEGSRMVVKGTLSMTRGMALDPDATVLRLDSNAPPEFNAYWLVDRNILFMLDDNLNPRLGTASWSYVLNRTR